jgi:hypothetical protein
VARRHLVRRGALAAACATWTYLRLVRPWHQRWGATDDEVRRPLPGDEQIPQPTVQSTRAITIAASPQEVWPWVAQIGYVGYGRAGWYAFDFWDADAGGGRSSWRLLPEAQQLQVGLRIGEEGLTVGRSRPTSTWSWPTTTRRSSGSSRRGCGRSSASAPLCSCCNGATIGAPGC